MKALLVLSLISLAAPAAVRAQAATTLRFTPQQDLVTLDPVTTTAGRYGSSTRCARFIAPSVPVWPSSSSPRPVTTIGSSCGGSASV